MAQLIDVAQPNVASSPMNSSWFNGVGDFLSTALDGYIKLEQIQTIKDSGNLGQVELTSTVQTPNPNTNQTYVDPAKALAEQNKNFAAQAGQYLQTGVGLAAVAVGGIAILYWLTR